MARPQRNNVDYFPHPVSHGKKMFIIRQKFGNEGYAVWFQILEELGEADNHYLDLSDEDEIIYLAAKFLIIETRMLEIISELARIRAIDNSLWVEYKVIFCELFVESVIDAYKKRSNKCITLEGLRKVYPVKVPVNPVKVPVNPQRKGKDSKEENNIDARTHKFGNELRVFKEKYTPIMLNAFYKYWTEQNRSKTKMKFELQKTWETSKRLATWAKNEDKFNNDQGGSDEFNC